MSDIDLQNLTLHSTTPRGNWITRKQACAKIGCGTTKLHDLLKRRLIEGRRLDGMVLIRESSIDELFDQLPLAPHANSHAARKAAGVTA